MDGTHRLILERNLHQLVKQITVTAGFLAEFVSMGIFTPEMVNTIMVENTNNEKVFKLINLLLRRGPDAFNMFIYILNKDHNWLASKLVKTGEIHSADLYMSNQQKNQLTKYRPLIEETVRLYDIWNDVEHIFNPSEEMEIHTKPNSRESMKKMLDILLHKSDVAFRHLVDALRQVNRRLAGLLEHGASGEEEPVISPIYNPAHINHDNQHRWNVLPDFDQNGRNEDFLQGYQSILMQNRALNNQNLFLQRQLNGRVMRQHRNRARYTLENTSLAFSCQLQ